MVLGTKPLKKGRWCVTHQRPVGCEMVCLFSLERIDSAGGNIGGVYTGHGVLAVNIEGPILAIGIPVERDAVNGLDLTGLISLGRSSIASDSFKDKWIGQLVDRIGKTILRTLKVNVLYPELLRHEYEFGAMIQKIDIQPFDAVDNDEWKIGDKGYTPNQFAVAKPNVSQTFFTDANTFKFKVTVPDTQLKTAFTSGEAMASFMDAVADTLEKSMIMAVNNMNRTAVNNFIAEKLSAGNGVIDLLKASAGGYNATLPEGDRFTSYAAAVIDPGFQKFAALKIKSFIK